MLVREMGTIAILARELATYSTTVQCIPTCLLACLLTYIRYYLLPLFTDQVLKQSSWRLWGPTTTSAPVFSDRVGFNALPSYE